MARELIVFFCLFVASAFLFDGAIFVSSAAFNNLGYPTYSTVFNWGRSTLGIIPFAWVGGHYFGADGVLAGRGLGAVIFGVASMVICFRTVAAIARGQASAEEPLRRHCRRQPTRRSRRAKLPRCSSVVLASPPCAAVHGCRRRRRSPASARP